MQIGVAKQHLWVDKSNDPIHLTLTIANFWDTAEK